MSVYLQPSLQLFRFPPLPNSITEASCRQGWIFKKHSDMEFPSIPLTHVTGSLEVLSESWRFVMIRFGHRCVWELNLECFKSIIRQITRITAIKSLTDSWRDVCLLLQAPGVWSVFPRNNHLVDRTWFVLHFLFILERLGKNWNVHEHWQPQ